MSEQDLYKDPGEDDYDDGHEIAVLTSIHQYPSINIRRNNPLAIASAIDDLARQARFSDDEWDPPNKKLVADLMSVAFSSATKIFLELGSYVGYSDLALGSALRDLKSL